MLWFILSLATAFFVATEDSLIKKFFGRLSPYDMAIAVSLYSLPFLIIYIFFIPIPKLDTTFWQLSGILIPLHTFAFYLHMKAIKLSPLSLSIPFLSFTPVFMIFTGLIVLDEVPNGWGMVGIGSIVAGSYLLNVNKVVYGYLAPFRAILNEPGSLLMLIVAFIYSILTVLCKKAIQHSSPLFFGFFFLTALDLTILIVFPFIQKIEWKTIFKNPIKGLSVGLIAFLHLIFHCIAINMVEAVYMIAVKRMSIIFSVLYGWLLFKETNIGIRMLGALLMFVGAVFIILLG